MRLSLANSKPVGAVATVNIAVARGAGGRITLKACKTCGKAAPVRPTIEELAAKKLQGMFRSRKALMYIRLLLRATVEKLYDKETGFYYYYNKSTGEAQ